MSLKLCPICEEEAIVRTVKDSCNYFVTCKNGCICTQPYETQEEAEREWNERGTDGAKPEQCPFCGADSEVQQAIGFKFYVRCNNCGASQSRNYTTKAAAIRAWNRRIK